MSGNINTYQLKPFKKCCGFDVDANEDGCYIIPCDCYQCTNSKTDVQHIATNGVPMANNYNKDNFVDFLEAQTNSGYNVVDPRARAVSGLDKDTYLDIITNYDDYYRRYIKDINNIK